MKISKQHLLLLACALVLLALVFAVVPDLMGTFLAAYRAPEAACARAARDYGALLAELDRQFANDHGEADEDWDVEALTDDLAYLLRGHPQILLSFADDDFCDIAPIRDARKRAALRELVDEAGVSGGEVCAPLQDEVRRLAEAEDGPTAGAASVAVGARSCVVVWRRLCARTEDLTGVSLCGFVVDSSLTDGLLENSRIFWKLATALSLALLLLLAVAAGCLVQALRKVRREALAKTTFVSSVSHELRTPLTSMLLYAEMLAAGRCASDERRAKALGVIVEEGHRLDRLVAELLDFSRVERGTRQYRRETFDLAEVVRGTVERLRGSFAEKGIRVEAPGRVRACADRDTVKQILENLLTNAAKYAAHDGPVEVTLAARGSRLRLEVADRGPGLTAAQMRHVFEAFWRADDRVTRTTGGSGLGLSIARAHARGMGGELAVVARAGGGCVFALELPNDKEGEHGGDSGRR